MRFAQLFENCHLPLQIEILSRGFKGKSHNHNCYMHTQKVLQNGKDRILIEIIFTELLTIKVGRVGKSQRLSPYTCMCDFYSLTAPTTPVPASV